MLRKYKERSETGRKYLKIMYLINDLILEYIDNTKLNNKKTKTQLKVATILKKYITK